MIMVLENVQRQQEEEHDMQHTLEATLAGLRNILSTPLDEQELGQAPGSRGGGKGGVGSAAATMGGGGGRNGERASASEGTFDLGLDGTGEGEGEGEGEGVVAVAGISAGVKVRRGDWRESTLFTGAPVAN